MFFDISLGEILLILVVTLMVVGPERIPEIARKAGKLLRQARRAGNMLRDIMVLEEDDDLERRLEIRKHEMEARKTPGPSTGDASHEPIDVQESDDYRVPGSVPHGDGGPRSRPNVRPVLLLSRSSVDGSNTVEIEPGTLGEHCRTIDLDRRASLEW